MKIGIYDKWIRELGGGEKVALVMTEVLLKMGHDVELISYTDIDKSHLERKLGVKLSKARMVTWFERRAEKLVPRTRKYDLFINVSYLDHLPSEAEKSIYYIHFPTPIRRTILGFIKYETVLPFLRKFLIIPEISGGFNPLDEIIVRSGHWLGRRDRVIISNSPKRFVVTFRIYVERFTTASLDLVSFVSPNCKIKVRDKHIEHRNSICTYMLEVELLKDENPIIDIRLAKLATVNNLALVSFTVRHFRYFLLNVIKRFLPAYEMALYGSSSYRPAAGLDTYDTFLANSNFTKYWTKRYWGKEARLLYPPVDIEEFKAGRKKNFILNVGRFFIGGHSKKQDILVKAFREMVNQKMFNEDWELHLVGGVAVGNEHESFVKELQKEAAGFPIFFHFYANFTDLKKLYSEAKIYWHATGFGENMRLEPIKFEHFGITVVEAMASGCVPVIFAGGGIPEAVSDKEGFVWKSTKQLKQITQKLAHDKKLSNRLSKNAQVKAKYFSRNRFAKEFIYIVNSL